MPREGALVCLLALSSALLNCNKNKDVMINEFPRRDVIDLIEHRLADEPCIGDLANWSRHYKLWSQKGRVNHDVVVINMKRVGKGGIRTVGPVVISQEMIVDGDPDDLIAYGLFSWSKKTISQWFCGRSHDIPTRLGTLRVIGP